MYSDIQEIRALLLQFERAALKDIYLKTGDWAVFMARASGGHNPMLGAEAAVAESAARIRRTAAAAPHLGVFACLCAVGDVIEPGALVGTIDVLGRKTEIHSEVGGTVVAAATDALVEYGEALVELEAD